MKDKFIFVNLVKNKKDVIGMTAYSCYKFEKKQFIEKMIKERDRLPSEKELADWQHGRCVQSSINRYREEGSKIIQDLVEKIYKSKHIDEKLEKITQYKFDKRKKFWFGVSQSLFSSLIIITITVVIGVSIVIGFDLVDYIINLIAKKLINFIK